MNFSILFVCISTSNEMAVGTELSRKSSREFNTGFLIRQFLIKNPV